MPLFLYPPADRARIAATFPDWARVTNLRCSCHEYRTMAFGHVDLIAAPEPKPWDHAAGVLVACETGGGAWTGKPGYDVTDTASMLTVLGNLPLQPDWIDYFRR